jgi:START domain
MNSPMGRSATKKNGAIESSMPASKALDKLLEIEAWDVKQWTEVHKSENIQVYKIKEEDSPVILIKAYAFFEDIAAEKIFRLIYDLEIRNTWDTTLHNMRLFDRINDNVDHMYSLFKAPGIGVSDRDFCQKRTKSMGYKGTSFIIHFESVDHTECPPIKKVVRAHTSISGYIIRPSQRKLGSSEMTIMTQTDIKVLDNKSRVWSRNGS